MKELAQNILDIAKNSVDAGAAHIAVTLTEDERGWLTIVIEDDGCGMSPALLAAATDPFTTTRTTRKVGLGLPLYRMEAEQTGGGIRIQSQEGAGTTVTATFDLNHLDCPPMGDLPGAIALLIQGSPDITVAFRHITPAGRAELFTNELREVLGDEISLAEPAVFKWICDSLAEQESLLKGAEAI